MATPVMSLPETLSKAKLDALQVSVNEVGSDSPPHSIDRLMAQSPPPHLHPPTITRSPRPIANDPNICVLPAHEPGRLRASSPTGSVRSSYTSHRRVSRRSRHSHVTSRSHSSEVSRELTIQAESEFFALMELMSGITLRSTSLKEVWRKLISERESHASEMESMYERIEEFTEMIERHEKEKHSHGHDQEERKKELVKLQLDLKIAIDATSGYKKKLADRDCELEKAHGEISELTDNFKYVKEEHEVTKSTLEETQLKLVASEEHCRHVKAEVEKHHGEIRGWKHKYLKLETSRTELSTKFESTHKELHSVKHVNSTLRKERSDLIHEKDELEEEVRRCKHREQEHKRKLKEVTESYEKKTHEFHELTEKMTKMKHEREELHKEVKILKSQIDEAHHKCEAADDACRKWKRKWDECERDLLIVREELSVLQVTHTETTETLIKKTEEMRTLIIEKDQLIEDHHAKCAEATESHRQILVLQESLRRTEVSIKEKLETIHTHTERIERLTHDLSTCRKARDDLSAELLVQQNANMSLNLSLETLTSEHTSVREKLHECETRYEAVHASMTEYHESGGEYEEEIESLNVSLEEAREQRDRAVKMRVEADRQRDEYVGRYEAKCREVERLSSRGKKGLVIGGGRERWVSGSSYSRSVIGEEDEEVGSVVNAEGEGIL